MAKALDTKVKQMMDRVKAAREKVGALKKPQWATSCSLAIPGWERVNIQVETNTSILAHLRGFMISLKAEVAGANRDLGLTLQPRWQNYLADDWIADLELRLRIIFSESERRKLADLEAKIFPLLSEDQRREMALAEIEKLL